VVGMLGGLETPDPQEGLQRGTRDPLYHVGRVEECALSHSIREGRLSVVAENLREESQHLPADPGRVVRPHNRKELTEAAGVVCDLKAPALESLADPTDKSIPALIELVCSDLEDRFPRCGRPDLHVDEKSVVTSEVQDQEAEVSHARLEVQAVFAPPGG